MGCPQRRVFSLCWSKKAHGRAIASDGLEQAQESILDDKKYPPFEVNLVHMGGIRGKEWILGFRSLSKQNNTIRDGVELSISVDITFFVPSRHRPIEFEGIPSGYFSRKDSWLKIQVALPGDPVADARREFLELLPQALDVAEDLLNRRKITGGLPELRELVARLTAGEGLS